MNKVNKALLMILLASSSTWANYYVDVSGGVLHRELSGSSNSYKSGQGFNSELSIGHKWKSWDFGIDGNYGINRQKDYNVTYDSTALQDDYNWQSVSIGPTVKYHIESKSGNWAWAPFIGLHYSAASLNNSHELQDGVTGKTEDSEHEMWGYGGKFGVQFKTFKPNSSWLEAISYKVYGSYTRYRGSEASYQAGASIRKFDGDTPDNQRDYTIGLLVGISFGDKVYSTAKRALGFN